jgi:hypothetical protein
MYLREKKLANFRDRAPRPKHNSKAYKLRPGMSVDHLTRIRNLACCVCAKAGGEAHHLKAGTGERGMGLRSTDKWSVPMCHTCHMEVERVGSRNEQAWFSVRGIYASLLAMDLWGNTGDLRRMERVLVAHRELGKT